VCSYLTPNCSASQTRVTVDIGNSIVSSRSSMKVNAQSTLANPQSFGQSLTLRVLISSSPTVFRKSYHHYIVDYCLRRANGVSLRYLLPATICVMRFKFTTQILIACLVVGVSLVTVRAQETEAEKKKQEAEQKLVLRKKAGALVDEIAAGALSLKLPENRSFVLAAAADLMWEQDEIRARSLFGDALNSLNLMLPQPSKSGDAVKDQRRDQTLYFELLGLKQELLRRVARRDPQLALDMLRNSRQVFPDTGAGPASRAMADEQRLEQQIAAEATAHDPEKAFQIARDSLARGFSFELLDLLYRLNQARPELATRFAGEITDKLRSRNLATDMYGGRFAISLLEMSRRTAEPATENTSAKYQPLKLADEDRRELVEMLTNAALTPSATTSLLYGLNEIMPEVREFLPERVPELQRRLDSFSQTLSKNQRMWSDFDSLAQSGTPEDMVKLANHAGNEQRQIDRQAVVLAVMQKRADAFRDFVNSEIHDDDRRQFLIDSLDAEQINGAAIQGDAEGLEKLLAKVRRKEERARAMSQIALLWEKAGRHDEALKLLNEAQYLVKTDFESETQTNALLSLILAYAIVEPSKAFALVERTVDHANDDVSKALLLDKIVRSGAVSKGEIRIQQFGILPLDFMVFRYGKGVAALARVDFERTRAAADRFERNELRLLARLLLAQSVLRTQDSDLGTLNK